MMSNDSIMLRKLVREDVDNMELWGSHDETRMLHYNFPSFTTHEKDIWYRIKTKRPFKKCYAIVCMDDKSLIGYISLRNYNLFTRSAELGIVLNPDEVNMGYGTLAIDLFLEHIFKYPAISTMKLHVALYNIRALNCYRKVGFKKKYRVFREFEDQSMGEVIKNRILMEDKNFKLINNKLYTQYYLMEVKKRDYSTKVMNIC